MLKAPHSENMILAFDFGTARIGVAYGAEETQIAHPIETLFAHNKDTYFELIDALIQEWQPTLLVVGLPKYMDGNEHEMTQRCRRFARRLFGRYALPVHLVDERLSSAVAESLLKEALVFGKKQKDYLDQVAALAILQSFFESGSEETIRSRRK